MKEIQLTRGLACMVDDEDFDLLNEMRWQAHGYVVTYASHSIWIGSKHKTLLMHRIILNASPNVHVDHIDGNGLNNQKANLRTCNRSENICNQKVHSNSISGIRGVRYHTKIKKWQARIQKESKPRHLGYFDTPALAAAAYREAALNLHGVFARPSK